MAKEATANNKIDNKITYSELYNIAKSNIFNKHNNSWQNITENKLRKNKDSVWNYTCPSLRRDLVITRVLRIYPIYAQTPHKREFNSLDKIEPLDHHRKNNLNLLNNVLIFVLSYNFRTKINTEKKNCSPNIHLNCSVFLLDSIIKNINAYL